MHKYLLLVLSVLALGCTDESSTREALEAQGMTDVQIVGYAPFSCSKDDGTSTGFTATNPQGRRVEGVVCCGWLFKNCTVRW